VLNDATPNSNVSPNHRTICCLQVRVSSTCHRSLRFTCATRSPGARTNCARGLHMPNALDANAQHAKACRSTDVPRLRILWRRLAIFEQVMISQRKLDRVIRYQNRLATTWASIRQRHQLLSASVSRYPRPPSNNFGVNCRISNNNARHPTGNNSETIPESSVILELRQAKEQRKWRRAMLEDYWPSNADAKPNLFQEQNSAARSAISEVSRESALAF
jgi:hypothetical protein